MSFLEKGSDNLKAYAKDITELLRKNFLNNEGILIQGRVGEQIINNTIIDDFGDVAPFIALYGGEDVCKNHIDYIKKNINNLGFDRAFAYTDLILGLVWYGRVGLLKDEAINLAISLAEQAENRWFNKGRVYSMSYRGLTLPVTNGIDTTFIEVWTELYRQTKDEKYSRLATETYLYYSQIQKNNPTGLIPLHHTDSPLGVILKTLYREKFDRINVMKDNTNYLFGLLDMVRLGLSMTQVKESFNLAHNTLSSYARQNRLNNILSSDKTSDLLSSFSFIDVSCDAYQLFKEDKYLIPAVCLADSWLSLQMNQTGLFPRNYSSNVSYFDSETDMAVALIKLYECTGNFAYKAKAVELLKGILKYHRKREGYVLQVNIYDGSVFSESFKTKFVALLIKLLHILSEERNIYEDDELFMLAKDR